MAMNQQPTRATRRARMGLNALVLIGVATASLVIANVVAERRSIRLDLTATGEHRLSPRTATILSTLNADYELVLAGPLSDAAQFPPRAIERVRDVLERLDRESAGRTRLSIIDTAQASGAEAYRSLITRLVERERANIDRQTATMQSAIADARDLAQSLEALQTALLTLRQRVAGSTAADDRTRQYLELRAGECGVTSRSLADAVKVARDFATPPAQDAIALPQADRASAVLKPLLQQLPPGMVDIERTLKEIDTGTSSAAGLIGSKAAQVADVLDRLPRLELSRVAAVLERNSALVVMGPPPAGETKTRSITAIPLNELIPADEAVAGADVGRNAEELIGTALASIATPNAPIVTLVHGQSRGFFDRTDLLEAARRRLGLRGMDVLLWEAAVDKEPPATRTIDPTGARPIVYVVLNTQSHMGSGRPGESGAERAKALGVAVARLVDEGKPILLNAFPSTLPTFGDRDPTIAPLKPLGIDVDTGRALLRERMTPEGRRVEASLMLRGGESDLALGRAIVGLPIRIDWPIAITTTATGSSGTRVWPLLRATDAGIWNESEWLSFIQMRLEEHPTVPNPPAPGGPKDQSPNSDAQGWIVALAAERTRDGKPQRFVIVGGNTWFLTPTMDAVTSVDGRLALAHPGNAELLEASVYWLAGQDQMIGQSATARAAPLIKPLSDRTLSAIRLGLAIGLPALVLVVGGLTRTRR